METRGAWDWAVEVDAPASVSLELAEVDMHGEMWIVEVATGGESTREEG